MKVKGNTPVIERLNSILDNIKTFKENVGDGIFTIKELMAKSGADLATANLFIKKAVIDGVVEIITPGHRGRGGAGTFKFNMN